MRLLVPLVILACAFAPSSRAWGQTRPTYFDEPAEIRVVGAEVPGEPLPVIVVLAPTGNTSVAMFEYLRDAIPFERYLAILPAGTPVTSDYLPAFSRFVGWMETRVLADLARARTEHAVDERRVFLAGFSLGGDTSWALFARHPETFRGALVMGSRASARPNRAALGRLRTSGARVAFAIGSSDEAVRVSGADRAHAAMNAAGIRTQMAHYDGAHSPPDPQTLASLIAFVMTEP